MVEVRGLKKRFVDGERTREVLAGADLDVAEGAYLAVIGESGSGKSTLLSVLGGLDRDYQGEVRVAGQLLQGLSDDALADYRSRTVGFLFQSFHLLPELSCLENVLLPARFGKRWTQEDATARAEVLLERVGLSAMRARPPANLSGGEKQRVALARALFNSPPLLLCDEPTGNLDRETGERILTLFDDLRSELGVTLIMVTHEARLARRADRVLRLEAGQLVDDAEGGAAA